MVKTIVRPMVIGRGPAVLGKGVVINCINSCDLLRDLKNNRIVLDGSSCNLVDLFMKLNAIQLNQVYCALMSVLYPANPGIQEMITRADSPEGRRNPGPISGLKDAINDQFSFHAPFSDHERMLLDAELQRRGLPPLYVIEASRNKKYQGILNRKKIRNQEEFYIVKGLLDDQLSELNTDDLQLLGDMMCEHICSQQKKNL